MTAVLDCSVVALVWKIGRKLPRQILFYESSSSYNEFSVEESPRGMRLGCDGEFRSWSEREDVGGVGLPDGVSGCLEFARKLEQRQGGKWKEGGK